MPDGVTPVTGFEASRYLGKWYEIARLDHSFERGMDMVSAQYERKSDGGIKVINRGFITAENKWKEAVGKAYFMGSPDVGYLKVSFFGPFYGAYIVFGLDQENDKENYQYAFISSYNTDYLWLLSRTKTVSPEIMARFIEKSKALGFDTDKLIFPHHGDHRSNGAQ